MLEFNEFLFNCKELLIWAKNTPMKNLSAVSGCYLKCDRVKVRGFFEKAMNFQALVPKTPIQGTWADNKILV